MSHVYTNKSCHAQGMKYRSTCHVMFRMKKKSRHDGEVTSTRISHATHKEWSTDQPAMSRLVLRKSHVTMFESRLHRESYHANEWSTNQFAEPAHIHFEFLKREVVLGRLIVQTVDFTHHVHKCLCVCRCVCVRVYICVRVCVWICKCHACTCIRIHT